MFINNDKSLFRLDDRLVFGLKRLIIDLPAPLKISYMWNYGSLLGLYLLIQIFSGLFLSMFYSSSTELAFESIKLIFRDIWWGWFIRYIHVAGASGYFIFLYFHISRGLYYGSFQMVKTWRVGVSIFLLSMAAAFLGYVLPWGQMSYWGATVITNFLSVVPYLGDLIVVWVWGRFSVDYPTLNRFFSLHFLIPLIILALVVVHVIYLHESGSNKRILICSEGDKVPFFPYFLWKDLVGFLIRFFFIFKLFLICPEIHLERQNYIQAKPLITPTHIQPEWYFLAAYAVLRSVPNKLGGVVGLLVFVLILYVLPLSKKLPGRNLGKHRPFKAVFQFFWWVWVLNFLFLTWLGSLPVEEPYVGLSQVCRSVYFIFFYFIFVNNYIHANPIKLKGLV